MDDPEQLTVFRDGEWSAPRFRDRLGKSIDLPRRFGIGAAGLHGIDELQHGIAGAFSYPGSANFHPAHPTLRGERNEPGADLVNVTAADALFLLSKHYDGAAFGRL